MEFLDISSLGMTYRYVVKIEQKLKQKTQTVWVCKPLTVEAGKRWPQPIEQRVEKGWTTSGQPVQTTNKEGQWEDKERHWEMV
jgi:hypothetical protein